MPRKKAGCDGAELGRADACEQQAKDANLRAERVSTDFGFFLKTYLSNIIKLNMAKTRQ